MVQSTPPRDHGLEAVRGKVELVVEEHSRIKGKGRSREFLSLLSFPPECFTRLPRSRSEIPRER